MSKFKIFVSFLILLSLLFSYFYFNPKLSSELVKSTNAAALSTTAVYAGTYECDLPSTCNPPGTAAQTSHAFTYVYQVDANGAKVGNYVVRVPRSTGLAISPDGRYLYYTTELANASGHDASSYKYIYRIDMSTLADPDNPVHTTFANLTTGWIASEVSLPRLGVGPDGTVYASTTPGGYFYKISSNGTKVYGPTQASTTGGATLGVGGDIAISSDSLAYMVDNAKNFWQVNLASPNGGLKLLGTVNTGSVSEPAALAFSSDGTLMTFGSEFQSGSPNNHDVVKITIDGSTGGLASQSTLGVFGTYNSQANGVALNGRSADAFSANFPNVGPQFSVTKTATDKTAPIAFTDANGTTAQATAGDTLEYKIIIRNTGNIKSVGTVFKDVIPTGTTYVANSATLNGAAIADNAGNFACSVGTGCSIKSATAAAGEVWPVTNPVTTTNDVTIIFRVVIDVARTTPVSNFGTVDYTDSALYGGPSDSNTVTTPLAATNNPPVATDDTYITPYNTAVTLSPLTWTVPGPIDSDPDADTLTLESITGTTGIRNLTTCTAPCSTNVTGGVVTYSATKVMTFTPNNGYIGTSTFTYKINDGNGGTATATETIKIVHATVDKSSSTTNYNNVGDVINYNYVLTNKGSADIKAPYSVTDDKVTTVTCPQTPTPLTTNQSITCTGSYTIVQADLNTNKVTNVAYAKVGYNDGLTDKTYQTPNDTITVPGVPSPKIELEKTGSFNDENADHYAQVGETISYQFNVKNTGNVTLTNVTITDPLITVVGTAIPTLLPGQSNSINFTGTYTITQADIDAGLKQNIATATGKPPTGSNVTDDSDDTNDLTNKDPDNDGDPDDPTVVTLPQNPKLTLTKTADKTVYQTENEIIKYTYVAKNEGNVTLSAPINVVDNILGTKSCSTSNLNVGVSVTCSFEYKITAADMKLDKVTNVAKANAKFGNTTIYSNEPTVTITKSLAKTGEQFGILFILGLITFAIGGWRFNIERMKFIN